MMDWLKEIYAAVGAEHPVISQILVTFFGAALFGSAWWIIGQNYRAKPSPEHNVSVERNSSQQVSEKTAIGVVHGNVIVNQAPSQNVALAGGSSTASPPTAQRAESNAPLSARVESPASTAINGQVFQASPGPDDKIYITGSFSAVGEELHVGFARLHRDGSIDSSFAVEVDGGGFAIGFLPNGDVLLNTRASGVCRYSRKGAKVDSFQHIGGQRTLLVNSRGEIYTSAGKYDSTGRLLTRFDHSFEALAMAIQPDGRVLLGGMNGQLIRLNSNGELDITFTPPVGIRGGNVHGLGVQSDGKIIVTGGAFALLPNVFRLNSDGTQDKRFRTEASVYGPVLVLGDDSILISSGNNGTAIGRDIRGRVVCAGSIVRLGPDGNLSPAQLQLDPSFANVPGVAVYLTP